MVELTKDNTDVNKLRRRMVDTKLAFEEAMLREISRFNEEMADLDEEIREGMSNRVGSGIQPNEAKKYADRLVGPILRDSFHDLEQIATSLKVDIATMVGMEFIDAVDGELGGIIGNAGAMNYETSELAIQKLDPPAPMEG